MRIEFSKHLQTVKVMKIPPLLKFVICTLGAVLLAAWFGRALRTDSTGYAILGSTLGVFSGQLAVYWVNKSRNESPYKDYRDY